MIHSVYICYTYLSECTANRFAGNDARFPIVDSFFFFIIIASLQRAVMRMRGKRERKRKRKKGVTIE